MQTKSFRPLYLVEKLSKGIGIDIVYAFEDLVFFEHSELLVQFDDSREERLKVYFHAQGTDRDRLSDLVTSAAQSQDIDVALAGSFTLKQKEGTEEVEVVFS